jgi:glycosyltransferase involved in cell wall biosynthesis
MAERIKVAHVITRLELGGAQQNTLYCCEHHDRRRYEVILICGTGGYLDAQARKIKNCRTYFLPELKHPVRPWWDLLAFFKIASILKKEKVQIVHTHSSKAGLLGRWAARWAGVPHGVHTIHGWSFFKGQFFPVRWLYQTLERCTAPLTDRLIAVSADNQREGLQSGIGHKGQYRVIHSGILPQKYVLSSSVVKQARRELNPKGWPCVLVLSNLKKQKSPLDVVEAARFLASKIPSVLFLWAGDGPFRDQVKEKIEKNGLENNFRLLGWREDVAKLLAASDVMLLTSLHEGLPRVVLQAMAAGKPVVATAVNGTPEAVKNEVSGFLTEPHATTAMAASLFKILSRPALGHKMGLAGKRSLRGTFLIDKMLQEIELLYDELVFQKR